MIDKADLDAMKDDIKEHLDTTIIPIQKQVDKNQKHVEDLYQKDTKTQVALAAVPGAIKNVDTKHDGKHQEIKSSAKTAYMVIGTVLVLITIGLTIVALAG